LTQTQLEALEQSIVADLLKNHRAEYAALMDIAVKRALANMSAPAPEGTP
jgi:hypothetical protein